MLSLDWLRSYSLGSAVRALSLAREAELLLARLDDGSLALLTTRGDLQARTRLPAAAAGGIADDGSAIVAGGAGGQVWWLARDLSVQREISLGGPLFTAAVEPFGRYVAVSDRQGRLHLYDRIGKPLARIESPRPLHHLAFVPAQPQLAAAADFGWAGCLDLFSEKWLWSDRPVSNIGALAVAGDGNLLMLACFSDGLRRYGPGGQPRTAQKMPAACGLVALSFTGDLGVAASASAKLYGFDSRGEPTFTHDLDNPPTALAYAHLGDRAFVAHADGKLTAMRMKS